MDYRSLEAEIRAHPECQKHIVTNDMPKDLNGPAKDAIIANILSLGRTRLISKEIGDGAVSVALGVPDGPVFLYRLRQLASTILAADASLEQITPVAVAQQVVASLSKAALDIGNAQVRSGIELFAGSLLSTTQVDKLKALAEVPDIVTAADVSRALRGPWE